MFELVSQVDVQAPAERVWAILTDFARFPEWNPFIHSAEGTLKKGEHLRVDIGPTGGQRMRFKPRVLVVEPGRELRWLGNLWLPGLFDGEHIFILEPLSEDTVRFIQKERFSGILVPLLRRQLEQDTGRGFDEMNQALKRRAETGG